jgi:ubiquinone/menaquinone biosynthesis C-methylase UbiE
VIAVKGSPTSLAFKWDIIMTNESMKPYGLALLDYYHGNEDAVFLYERDDGFVEQGHVSVLFRKPSGFFKHEHKALDLCYGYVLDIGAGAGIHSLTLQDKGLKVTAIDISPEAVSIMARSGVKDVHCSDIHDLKSKTFDTLLLLGRGIGMAGNLNGLQTFLIDVKALLKKGGQLLLNSCDVSNTSSPEHLSYHELNMKAGRYIGEIGMRFRFKNVVGESFSWLHVDAKTLSEYASKTGWKAEVIDQEEDGNYLARLTIKTV